MFERLTSFEEKLRDRTLGRIVGLLMPRWIHPNHITALRICLVGVAIILFLAGQPLKTQTWVLIAAALTDSIDGMLARARKLSSRAGAYLDHFSDWLVGGWMGILALVSGALGTGMVILIIIPQVIVTITDRIKASHLEFKDTKARILALAMGPANFSPNTVSRLQFVAVLTGFSLVLFSKANDYPTLRKVGAIFLYIEICLAWVLVINGLLDVSHPIRNSRRQVGRSTISK
ncbi:MAG: CDP-alcohol phosphatidyltransferase family protein [Firmicutes bacterium]|nr:CDP-alcohol phosphatidyltransferase family protein [Bacillota bacterium]